jgi:hypothetical protein
MKLTERNQVIVPGKIEGGESWAELPRVLNPQESLRMPPGEDAAGPHDWGSTAIVAAGKGDVSGDVNEGAARKGFTRLDMKPYDDQYSNEHKDGFYDTVTVDGKDGAVERNNYLDRS